METHRAKKTVVFLTCIRMIEISTRTYAENCISTVTVTEKGVKKPAWLRMSDPQYQLCVKNMSDLTI